MKVRSLALLVVGAFGFTIISSAQIPSETDTTSTPVPNAGHDYIQGMSETVNPANGSLSIRIGVPMPPGRGLTVPFGFDYDSNGSVYLGVPQCPNCVAPSSGMAWLSTNSMLARGGWSYGVPMLSVATDRFDVEYTDPLEQERTFVCQGRDNFVLQDANGNRRNLGLSYYNTNAYCQNGSAGGEAVQSLNTQYGSLLAQTSGAWQGTLSNAPGQVDPVSVTEADGTVYGFGYAAAPNDNVCGSIPCTATTYPPDSICDRNNNCLSITFANEDVDTPNSAVPGLPLSYTDSVGRPVLSIPTFGNNPDTISVYGFSQPYKVYWTTVKPNFTVTMTPVPVEGNDSCAAPSGQPSIPVISSIVLPNGQSYSFDYSNNPYGMIDKITYPTGGYVRYVWGVNRQSEYGVFPLYTQEIIPQPSGPGIPGPYVQTGGCQYYYDTPAILQRFVSFDGVHEVLEQDFDYNNSSGDPSTVWGTGSDGWTVSEWSQKTTTVTTYDLVRGTQYQTVYTYVPASVDYQPGVHSNEAVLPQVPVESQIEYYDTNGNLLETVDKGWLNERAISYQRTLLANGEMSETDWQYYPTTSYYPTEAAGWSYSATTEMMQYRYDYDYGNGGHGSLLRETYIPTYKNSFTNGQFIVDDPNDVEVLDGGGKLMAERAYSYDGNGNLLSRSDWLNSSGSQVLTTSHQYDAYGNIISTTDPAGNTTDYSYTNSFVDECSFTPAASAYLTEITYPSTAGAPSPDKESFQYYCATGELANSTDENGNQTGYQYDDPWNRLTEADYPAGWGKQTISYNDTPGAISIETKRLDSSGQVWSDAMDLFDGLFHQISQSDANGQSGWDRTDTCYDGNARVLTSVYPYQASSATTQPNCSSPGPGDTFVYDALGRVETQTHSDGTVITTAYTGRATDVKDEGNGTHNVERISQVDGLGRLTGVCEVTSSTQNGVAPASCGLDHAGTGFLTTYSYDASGSYGSLSNLTGVSQGSETRSFIYDMASRLTQSTNPETGTVTYKYDTDSNCPVPTYLGELISKTDARGIRTCMQYDARHRVLAKTYSDGTPSATYAYNQTSVAGRTLTNTVGRLSSEGTGGSYPTGSLFSYDAIGDVIDNSQCTPQNCSGNTVFPITYSYNVLGGPVSSTDGAGHTLYYGYTTTGGYLTGVTSSLNVAGSYPSTLLANVQYNAFGSPVKSSIGAIPLIDNRGYDVRGRLTSISVADSSATQSTATLTISGSEKSSGGPTPATGSVTIQGQEASGEFCADDGRNCHYKYNAGTVTVTVNGTNCSVYYGESSTPTTLASALSGCTWGGIATAVASGVTVNITSVAKGPSADYSLSESDTTTDPTDFGIPSFAAVSSQETLTGGATTSGPYDNGTVTLTVNGATSTASYGESDTPTTVAISLASAINANSSAVSATSSGASVTITSKASGAYTNYSFTTSSSSTNGFNPPSFSASPSGSSMSGGTGGAIYSAGVSYFPDGDVENSSDSINGNWGYTYDDFNRLNTAVSSTGLGCSEVYDQYGNRLQQNAYEGSCYTPQYSSTGNNNRINQFGYDLAGDVTNDGNYEYTYDAEGRVSTVNTLTGANIATYVYDAEGRRVRKILASGTTDDYLYDLSGHVISDIGSAGTWVRGEVYAGGAHLATYMNGTTYFTHADWLGTERVRSTVAGGIYSTWTSFPFGEGSLAPNPSPLHFTAKERDSESGNDYFGARYYASTMGRFLSPDPAGVGYADPSNPQSLNLYSYVYNNPLINIDPSGMECVWDDGSYDASDDPQTGSAAGCSGQGGTWVDPSLFESVEGNQAGSWSGQGSSQIQFDWLTPSATAYGGPNAAQQETAEITAEFLTGTGPTNVEYLPQDPFTLSFQKSADMDAINANIKSGCSDLNGPLPPQSGRVAVGTPEAAENTLIDGIVGGQGFLTPEAQIGAFNATWARDGGTVSVTVTNPISLNSLMLHQTARHGIPNPSSGPMRTINQTLHIEEPDPCF